MALKPNESILDTFAETGKICGLSAAGQAIANQEFFQFDKPSEIYLRIFQINSNSFPVKFSLQGIHRSCFCGNKQSVGSDPNMIHMRETCGQRSSMAVGSKRRVVAFYFSKHSCHRPGS